ATAGYSVEGPIRYRNGSGRAHPGPGTSEGTCNWRLRALRIDPPAEPPMSNRWFQIEHAAAQQLTQVTASPGRIVSLPMSAVPVAWQLPGAASYFASGYLVPQAQPTLTVGGEQVVLRTDRNTLKAYRWLFATSNDGNV